MDTDSPSPTRQVEELVKWFTENRGWLNPNVNVEYSDSHGFYIHATRDLDPHTCIVQCPLSLTLSYLNLDPKQSVVPHVSSSLTKCLGTLPNHVLNYLLLIEQLVLDEESRWRYYIGLLPDQDVLTTPLWFKAKDTKYLEETPLISATQSREDELRQQYNHARSAMLEAGMEGSETYEECDFETFKWAATIFSSRSFTSKYILPDLPAFPILFPVLDIANHAVTAKVGWEHTEQEPWLFSLNTVEKVKANNEVFNNYGPKQNAELLLGYGFAIQDNPVEQVALKPGGFYYDAEDQNHVPFGIELDFSNQGLGQETYYLRTPGHIFGRYANNSPFFRGFPPFIVFMAYTMVRRARDITAQNFELQHTSGRMQPAGRAVLATLIQLYGIIEVKCAQLQYPCSPPTSFRNSKEKYAFIYRNGQARIWDTMRRELRTVLQKLRFQSHKQITRAPVVVTFTEALIVMRDEHPQVASQFTDGMELVQQKGEQEMWVFLLAAFNIITRNQGSDGLFPTSFLNGESSLIYRWIQDLDNHYPFPGSEDIARARQDYPQFAELNIEFKRLQESRNALWRGLDGDFGNCPQRECYIVWALNVVRPEVFVMPDTRDVAQERFGMYMRAYDMDRSDEEWMYEEVGPLAEESEAGADTTGLA